MGGGGGGGGGVSLETEFHGCKIRGLRLKYYFQITIT